jgi:methylthioribose-1-phosphate isomerase
MVLEAIKYSRGQLQILDQLQLPHTEVYDDIKSAQDAWYAIKDMRTRGAPAIAIVAALGLAVELETIAANNGLTEIAEEAQVFIKEKLDYLVTSRPTAVNLADAARKLERIVQTAAKTHGASGTSVKDAYVKAAEQMLVDDVSDNKAIGEHGADWILKNAAGGKSQVSILTHCNTG